MLLQSQVEEHGTIIGDSRGWCIFGESIWSKFLPEQRRDVHVTRVAIGIKPSDGLPADMNPWPTESQRKVFLEHGGIEDYVNVNSKQLFRKKGCGVPSEDVDALDRAKYKSWLSIVQPNDERLLKE